MCRPVGDQWQQSWNNVKGLISIGLSFHMNNSWADTVIYFQPLFFSADLIDLSSFQLWDMYRNRRIKVVFSIWSISSADSWRFHVQMCLNNVAVKVWLQWNMKYVDASQHFLTNVWTKAEIKYLPSFSMLFPSLPHGWQEFRLLRLMTRNSWNPGFRQCAHFKRSSANSNLFFLKEDMHTHFFGGDILHC